MPRRSLALAVMLCRTIVLLVFFAAWSNARALAPVAAQQTRAPRAELPFRPGRVVIKLKAANNNVNRSAAVAQLMQAHALQNVRPLFMRSSAARAAFEEVGLQRIFIAQVANTTDIRALVAILQQDPQVEYAEPDYLLPLAPAAPAKPPFGVAPMAHGSAPNDSLFPQQQYLTQIKAEQAWEHAHGDSSVVIAIIDSGTEWQHPDLAANVWRNAHEVLDGIDNDHNGFVDDVRGWDFVEGVTDAMEGEDGDTPDNDPSDFVSHGTGVAGVAAAVTHNLTGIAALSWNVKFMPLRVGWLRRDFESVVSTAFSAAAFVYAADNGARIANLSAGSSRVVADAAQYAFLQGVVIISAAGNATNEDAFGLNLAPFALTVAAVNDRDEIASYSSYGTWVKVCAPGGDTKKRRPGILTTTLNGKYIEQQGTSFAAPLVASLAALLQAQHRDWSPAQITFQIAETADAIDALNPDYVQGKLGRGRINALRALTETITPLPEITLGPTLIADQGNGVLDAGETVALRVALQNVWGDALGLSAQLASADQAVTVVKNTANYGTLPGLADLRRNVQSNANDPFVIAVAKAALPHRVRFTLDLSAAHGYHQRFEFYLAIAPFVLLVDDDQSQVNVEKFYTQTLDSLGIAFDVYTHPSEGAQLDMLARYPNVIWFCEWAFPTLDENDRAALTQYLNNGGKLFLSGQDIGWDLSDAAPGLFNQFYYSRGASRVFYENYLRARYLNDDANLAALTGVANDPIGAGLQFDIAQPGRTVSEQLPSEIAPLAPAASIFNYANGRSGAVRSAGNQRVVYFAFGGFEAITPAAERHEVMARVLNWLNGYSFAHTPLRDTDDTTRAQVVLARINSSVSPLTSVALYWKNEAQQVFNKVTMTEQGGGVYRGEIPPQFNRTVEYFIQARNTQGFASPLQKYSYSTRPDTIPPVIASVTALPHTLSNVGPFVVSVQASDVNGIDTSAVWLHVRGVYAPRDSVKLRASATPNLFMGEWRGPLQFGDTLRYYASVRDAALRRNRALSAEQSFVIGNEGFENGLRDWRADTLTWGVSGVRRFAGAFAVNSNPGRGYANRANSALTFKLRLDFAQLPPQHTAFLQFQEQHYFAANQEDFGVVEVSRDGGSHWQQLGEAQRGTQSQWRSLTLPLSAFRAVPADSFRLRFRVQTDSLPNPTLPGWFIDEVRVLAAPSVAVQEPQAATAPPQQFALWQNYPNPLFQNTTSIRYAVPLNADIDLAVFDLIGNRIATLQRSAVAPGVHTATWNGTNERGQRVPSGIYFCRMRAQTHAGASFQQVRRVLVLQ